MIADLFSLEIADIRFVISGDARLRVSPPPPVVYLPFLNKPDGARCSLTVRISLELRDMPDVKEMTKVFDSGESWSMYRHLGDYVITLSPTILDNRTVWMARISKDSADVIIYCSDILKMDIAGQTEVLNPVMYPLDQLLMIQILSQKGGTLIHAAGARLQDKGYIFPGRSGAGKSTISKQFAGKSPWELLSDDRVAVRKMDKSIMVYGTPWAGEAGMAENEGAALSGIFFLHKGSENMLTEISAGEAFERLMPVTSVPWYDARMMTNVLSFCEDIVSCTPSYDLFFKPDSEVVDILEKYASS
ncbi:MAG TPA: hypothetical protein VK435_05370 [Thermodesulfovibrionales bacterium]|nr:hypothetical protein [Thermodesulfovibrionales bacterium]